MGAKLKMSENKIGGYTIVKLFEAYVASEAIEAFITLEANQV